MVAWAPMKKSVKWIIAVVVAAVLVLVGGPYIYIHFIQGDAPAALTFDNTGDPSTVASAPVATTTVAGAASTAAATPDSTAAVGATTTVAAAGTIADVEGVWNATSASVVGYRVKEVLFGQSTEAVGRTSDVKGTVTVKGNTVEAAEFTIDMTTVKSDQSKRDAQFKGRIMSVETFPTAVFKLMSPITLSSVPGDKVEITTTLTGELTLKGRTKAVSFDLKARRNGANIEVNGQIPVAFADYGIDNPSTTGITTEDNGKLEFLLVFAR